MTTTEINKTKLNLIAWIHQLSDIDMISFLDGLKNSSSTNDWWDELTSAQQKSILKGIKDADNSDMISSEEFWKNLKNV
jgi:hypothetical protein